MLNRYLCNRGYAILKSGLSEDEIKKIKSELTIIPYELNNKNPEKYYVYRESDKKIFVPKYYGIKKYGMIDNKMYRGDLINLKFNGELRENQKEPIEVYLELVKNGGGGLLELPCGFGKTSCSLYILSKLGRKTLIIVQKEFLMNQWIERINQFLPNARIGKIQGEKIDVENKDIVIGMLQSLSMKEYSEEIFKSFGMLIVDEVHHISSKIFSKALFKISPYYTLGLSATMNRNDGTSYVFKYFLGEVVYKLKNKEKRDVEVRCYEYKSKDVEFNKVETDFKGNPQYAKLLSKISGFKERNDFIIKIILQVFGEKEKEKEQMMVLAHNRNMLEYLHDELKKRGKSVGYYVGGMKENALKESEGKQIIIATYSMASEALDIKTLSILVMATPKTSIEQSVGRILRDKDSNPMVIDIVDSHWLYKNQWKKRLEYYKKEKYNIMKYGNGNGKITKYEEEENDDEIPMGEFLL